MRYWSIPKYRRVGVPVCHAFLYYKPCGSFPRKLQGRHALIFISGHSRRLLTTANVPHGGRRQHGFPRPRSALLLKYLHGLNIQCAGFRHLWVTSRSTQQPDRPCHSCSRGRARETSYRLRHHQSCISSGAMSCRLLISGLNTGARVGLEQTLSLLNTVGGGDLGGASNEIKCSSSCIPKCIRSSLSFEVVLCHS